MALFFGISPGEEKKSEGLRVSVSPDGEWVYLHGKWLELGSEHAVVYIDQGAEFYKPDGSKKLIGQFPAWVVIGKGKHRAIAMKTSITQFRGGKIRIGEKWFDVPK